MYYEKHRDGSVLCFLCPENCKIANGKTGFCKIRRHQNGKLYAEQYGYITSISLDPIEKKPLYHFCEKSMVLSIGGYGCNFRCPFCQNHSISMGKPEMWEFLPEQVLETAAALKQKGNIGVAYTYNEPFINFEYMLDTAKLIHDAGMKNIIITNGYVNISSLSDIISFIDAMNIDLKAYNSIFYDKLHGKSEKIGTLDSVKKTISFAAKKCHVELTTLVIPDENDSREETEQMAKWIAEIDSEIPLHLSRFFPNYKMQNKKPTPVETLQELAVICKKYLKHVYIGNV